jgi:cobalt-zinc-cadmium efflux system membrane fusion protein
VTDAEEPPRAAAARKRIVLLVAGAAALIGATIAVTVAVEHRLHGAAAGDHRNGEEGHGDAEHGDKGHGEHGEHGEHRDHGDGERAGSRVKLSPAQIENAKLGMANAAAGKVAVTLSLPGEVALNAEAVSHVTPRVSGTVREVKKSLGDVVNKGDVLAVLDSREYAEMQREVLAAKERLTLAEANFKRQDQLWQEKISAEKDYLAAKQALAEAKIEYRSAEQKLAAGAGPGKGGALTLTAPLTGTVIEKHAVVGEVLKDDSRAFVIADLSRIWVNVTVYARDLSKVRAGQSAIVRAEGIEQPLPGKIDYVDRVVGEQTRSATARIVLDNPGAAWRPGLFATADVVLEEVDAEIVVSHEAIQTIEGKTVVFVREGDAFEARFVRVGRKGMPPEGQREPVVEISGGLAPGDPYVAKNSFVLKAELGKGEAGHEH